MTFEMSNVVRTTKCFSPMTNGYKGGFPIGFLRYIKELGYWSEGKRVYLCCGLVDDNNAIRVDLNPNVNPTHLEDARKTSIPDCSVDWVMIDPPYSKELADKLYGLGDFFSSINAFTKEAERILKPNGLMITLSYEVPKRPKNCNLLACIGVYQTISVAHMRALTIWKKQGGV